MNIGGYWVILVNIGHKPEIDPTIVLFGWGLIISGKRNKNRLQAKFGGQEIVRKIVRGHKMKKIKILPP